MFTRGFFLLFFFLVGFQIPSNARIGETRIASIERYGPEIKKGAAAKNIPTANWSRFQSGKFILNVAFVEMQAVGVSYTTTATLLSASDTLHILAAEGTGWLPYTPDEPMRTNSQTGASVFLRSNEGLIAETTLPIATSVIIYTEWAFNRLYGQPLAKKALPPSL